MTVSVWMKFSKETILVNIIQRPLFYLVELWFCLGDDRSLRAKLALMVKPLTFYVKCHFDAGLEVRLDGSQIFAWRAKQAAP